MNETKVIFGSFYFSFFLPSKFLFSKIVSVLRGTDATKPDRTLESTVSEYSTYVIDELFSLTNEITDISNKLNFFAISTAKRK